MSGLVYSQNFAQQSFALMVIINLDEKSHENSNNG